MVVFSHFDLVFICVLRLVCLVLHVVRASVSGRQFSYYVVVLAGFEIDFTAASSQNATRLATYLRFHY